MAFRKNISNIFYHFDYSASVKSKQIELLIKLIAKQCQIIQCSFFNQIFHLFSCFVTCLNSVLITTKKDPLTCTLYIRQGYDQTLVTIYCSSGKLQYMQQSIQNNEISLLGFHNKIKNSVQFENYV